jgi:hypothetical protein
MLEFFKNLKLFTKFQLALFVVSVIAQGFIGITSYIDGRRLLQDKSFQLLESVTKSKKQAVEEYYQNIENQLLTLSENSSTIDALQEFQQNYEDLNELKVSPEELRSKLKAFYDQEFIEKLKSNSLSNYTTQQFLDKNPNPRKDILQYHYIATNPNPTESKYRWNRVQADNIYHETHLKYHPGFAKYSQTFGFEDIMLTDLKGNIIYTVNKSVDLGENLVSGYLKSSNLAKAFRKIMKANKKGYVVFADYSFYPPAYYKPTSFIATMVYNGVNKIGVLIFKLSDEKINQVMTSKKTWNNLGATGETNIVGRDYKIRTNTRSIIENPLKYYTRMENAGTDTSLVKKIRRLRTTILLRENTSRAAINALNRQTGQFITQDFLGNDVIYTYSPVNIFDKRWAIITEIDKDEVLQAVTDFRNNLLSISVWLFLANFVLGFWLARSLSRPMLKIQKEITMLSEGRFPHKTSKIYKDELGKIDEALNVLIESTRQLAAFAENVGKGNFEYQYKAKSEEDVLGLALLEMRDNLRNLSIEDEQRRWINEGVTNINNVLRDHSGTLQDLGKYVISELVKYLKASQGAFFLLDKDKQEMFLSSCYAYDRFKYLNRSVKKGEGLVGQAFQEEDSIYITEIPDGYSTIQSGLGEAMAKAILIVPLIANNEIHGIIELASFSKFEPHERQFIEVVSDNIAISINTVKSGEQTRLSLKESQAKSEKLQVQEKKMLQNLTELKETQEIMEKREVELEESREQLQQSLVKMKNMRKEIIKDEKARVNRVIRKYQRRIRDLEEEQARKEAELASKIKNLEKELGIESKPSEGGDKS